MLKVAIVLVLLLFSSMLVCPVLATVAQAPAKHNCGQEGQGDSGQQIKNCCDQNAVEPSEVRFKSALSSGCEIQTAAVESMDPTSLHLLSSIVPPYSKTAHRLATLSILRV